MGSLAIATDDVDAMDHSGTDLEVVDPIPDARIEVTEVVADAKIAGGYGVFGRLLAEAPAFRFVFSRPFRRSERDLRHALPAVVFGVKPREVLTEDFVCAITLDPLRPQVPGRHVPVGVEPSPSRL